MSTHASSPTGWCCGSGDTHGSGPRRDAFAYGHIRTRRTHRHGRDPGGDWSCAQHQFFSDPGPAERRPDIQVAEVAPSAAGGPARTGHPDVLGQAHHSDCEFMCAGGPDRSPVVAEPGRDRGDEVHVALPWSDCGIGLARPLPPKFGHLFRASTAVYSHSVPIGHPPRVTDVPRPPYDDATFSPGHARFTPVKARRRSGSATRMDTVGGAVAHSATRPSRCRESVGSMVTELSV